MESGKNEWFFTENELKNCPSVFDRTLTNEKELYNRQEAGAYIRDVSKQLCL